MGGEDWQMWIDALADAGVLANGCTTTAFTYVGEEITQAIYWNGSIGAAKKDLDTKVLGLREKLVKIGGDARVSVLKAVGDSRPARPFRPCRCTCRCCSR
jgi:enoyl-[acyl-carrier protein] reductase/trans-2-enoyl-CoA reductase (NAD+)